MLNANDARVHWLCYSQETNFGHAPERGNGAKKYEFVHARAARARRGARLVMVADRMFGFGGNSDAATAVIFQLKLHFVPLMTY